MTFFIILYTFQLHFPFSNYMLFFAFYFSTTQIQFNYWENLRIKHISVNFWGKQNKALITLLPISTDNMIYFHLSKSHNIVTQLFVCFDGKSNIIDNLHQINIREKNQLYWFLIHAVEDTFIIVLFIFVSLKK